MTSEFYQCGITEVYIFLSKALINVYIKYIRFTFQMMDVSFSKPNLDFLVLLTFPLTKHCQDIPFPQPCCTEPPKTIVQTEWGNHKLGKKRLNKVKV